MERRHEPATAGRAPGLMVGPYSAVAPYPSAAVLTAWANAAHVAKAFAWRGSGIVDSDEPVLPASAAVAFWPHARMSVSQALASLPEPWWPARCCLPVPGDLGGLPAGAPRALSAGQALVWSHDGEALVLSPMIMPGGDRMWLAERTRGVAGSSVDRRTASQRIMQALEECVELAESSLLPKQAMASAEVSRVAELAVPLPPGADASAVALARQSATLVAIVSTAMSALPDTSEAARLREALVPLGAAARLGLSVAFSELGGR